MNSLLKLIAVTLLVVKTSLLSAGCSYTPGGYTVIGNYAYDTASATYFFNQGDTLLAIYNGIRGGSEYWELHYLNNSILLGSRLDTIKVYREGTYNVEFGCPGGNTLNYSAKFLFNNPNSIPSIQTDSFTIKAHLNQASSSLFFSIASNKVEYFDAQIYDIQGKAVLKLDNLLSHAEYTFPLTLSGFFIIAVTDKKGISITKKIVSF